MEEYNSFENVYHDENMHILYIQRIQKDSQYYFSNVKEIYELFTTMCKIRKGHQRNVENV